MGLNGFLFNFRFGRLSTLKLYTTLDFAIYKIEKGKQTKSTAQTQEKSQEPPAQTANAVKNLML